MTVESLPPLLCPRCRRPAASPPQAARLVPSGVGDTLGCANALCGARYPVLDGVPVVLRDLESFLSHQGLPALVPLVGDEALELCLSHLAPEDPVRVARQSLAAAAGTALGAFLDRPPVGWRAPDLDAAPTAGAPLERWLDEWVADRATSAIDIGCGPGAATFALLARGLAVTALDVLLQPLRLLRRLATDGAAEVPLRILGSRYRRTTCRLPAAPGSDRLQVLAADALEPPLPAEHFDVAHLGNVLDNARSPLHLLGQADALLAPGGRLLLTCAAAYRADVTPEAEWLGATARSGADAPSPPERLRAVLEGRDPRLPHLSYRLLDERVGLEWIVYPDDATRVVYTVHAIVAEKSRQGETR